MRKSFCLAALTIAGSLLAQPAGAAEITFDGFTNGCFYTTTSCTPSGVSATLNELTFTNSSFGGTSIAGDLSVTLGTFSLVPRGNDDYSGSSFNLLVTFDVPLGLNTPSTTLTSLLTGTTSSAPGQCNPAPNPCGSVAINFNNNPIPFSFTSGNTTGSFFLTVGDLIIPAGQTVALTGRISGASQTTTTTPPPQNVPEPATLALFGSGLFLAASRARRSRRR
ncbi:MAG TPA: PEP-CTERM sorting domain-containing protein [Vicinamibacterales bacterium]